MSKQRRGREPGDRESAPPAVEGPRTVVEPELGVERPAPRTDRLADLAGAPEPAGRLADRVGLALRLAPKDAAATERLAGLVARSGLPADRRAAVVERLRGDQAVADAVARAVATWVGGDSEAARSDLVSAFDAAATALATAPGGELEVAAAVAERTGVAAEAVAGLCREVGMLLALWFEEDEEEAPAGDYAAEESGF